MGGYDFGILWQAGRAVWLGRDPYRVSGFYYPLPVAYIFALLAPLPRQPALWVLMALNLALLGWRLRRQIVERALYFPLLHLFSSGQVDLVLWALGSRLRTGWRSALAGAVITLKPQVAFIVLPWTLWRWLREDRGTLGMWAALPVGLWGCLLPIDPTWPRRWQAVVPPLGSLSRGNSPGLWSLERLWPRAWPVLLALSAAAFVWGLFQSRPVELGGHYPGQSIWDVLRPAGVNGGRPALVDGPRLLGRGGLVPVVAGDLSLAAHPAGGDSVSLLS